VLIPPHHPTNLIHHPQLLRRIYPPLSRTTLRQQLLPRRNPKQRGLLGYQYVQTLIFLAQEGGRVFASASRMGKQWEGSNLASLLVPSRSETYALFLSSFLIDSRHCFISALFHQLSLRTCLDCMYPYLFTLLHPNPKTYIFSLHTIGWFIPPHRVCDPVLIVHVIASSCSSSSNNFQTLLN